MDFEFDRHVAVAPAGADLFTAELEAGWTVAGGLNGGYLLAVVGSAARAALPARAHPVAVSAHYLGAGTPGPAEIETTVLRDGGSLATVSARLTQRGESRVAALVTVGELGAAPGEGDRTVSPPAMPPPERCLGREHAPPGIEGMPAMTERFDLRFDPDCIGWALGRPSGRGLLQGWFRFADGREPDPLALLAVVDSMPPVTFDLGLPGWAPTLALSAYVRAVPAAGWLRIRQQTRHLDGGTFEEDCEVWDSTGRLVAQGRQLARLPR